MLQQVYSSSSCSPRPPAQGHALSMTQKSKYWSKIVLLVAIYVFSFTGGTHGLAGGVSMSIWNNTALAGPAQHHAQTASIEWSGPGPALVSVEFTAALTAPTTGPYYFDCRVAFGSVIMWLDDHLMCGTVELFRPETAPLPPFYKLRAGEPHFLRLQFFHNESSIDDASVALLWSTANDAVPTPVPASALTSPPQQFATQLNRTRLQRLLATGWGSWYRPSALAATLLPEGGTLTAGLCQVSTSMCMDPAAPFTPEQQRGPEVCFFFKSGMCCCCCCCHY